MAFAIALLCAAVIGFAAHRASLCHVRAVSEVMSSGTGHMLTSLSHAALWAALVGGAISVVGMRTPSMVWLPSSAGWAVLGGWLFGVGAAVNGGCSLSTLHRLIDGEVGMVLTLLGFAAGVVASAMAIPAFATLGPADLVPVESVWQRWPELAPWLLALLVLWSLVRMFGFLQLARSSPATSVGERLFSPQYPLAVSAALMGVAGAILYATQGAWSYTNHLRTSVLQVWRGGFAPAAAHSAFVAALLLGMLASALHRASIAWRPPLSATTWLRHAVGGLLMGAGAAMVPGGNDTLLLNALPTLAVQAVGAYLSMLLGIAGTLWLMRHSRMPMATTHCTEAGCTETPSSAARHTRPETPR